MTVQRSDHTKTIGISISDGPDMQVLGLGLGHLRDAMTGIATHLLSSGDALAYGGDLRNGGFTQVLLELVSKYSNEYNVFISHSHDDREDVDRLSRVINYFAWPVHISLSNAQLDDLNKEVGDLAEVMFLDLDGEAITLDRRKTISPSDPDDATWSDGLTAMRRTMAGQIDARIILGGRVEGYKGRIPGVAEETLLSFEALQPVFLLGGFGGCARDIAETLGLVDALPGFRERWSGHSMFEAFGPDSLRNGLSFEENHVLARTPYIDEALPLVLRGLRRL